ncbi:MAG: 3-deoxy-7-phosphoheptulonate synthase [Spirochaetia bacterium]|nr:3-deoxy-7-phosphoheptulonate synthase [Spirochaetia bacterium]
MKPVSNVNVIKTMRLISPAELLKEFPVDDAANKTVCEGRSAVESILSKKDDRMLVIAGPCSIHDEKAAIEYAEKLSKIHQRMKDKLFIVMRVYFEKPRTTIGWKGLINDPHLNGTYDIELGLRKARKILLEINSMGLPAATELLDPIVPQYIADLVSWVAIGARTTESQTHREMASGLSMPVGFKNNTDGNLQSAIDAMASSNHPHSFLGIDHDGRISMVSTRGNSNGHIILRGGRLRPNYDRESVQEAEEKLKKAGTAPLIMVDCSHANSNKVPDQQEVVWKSIIDQRVAGNKNLIGLMLESNIHAGSQPLVEDLTKLKYGVSITDACINWQSTENLFEHAYSALKNVSQA